LGGEGSPGDDVLGVLGVAPQSLKDGR